MLAIDSSRARSLALGVWLIFAATNSTLMYLVPGQETIPYHLVWVSYVLLYGLAEWPLRPSLVVFAAIVVATGVPLIKHAYDGYIGWEESSEIPLMSVIAGLLMWHVRRAQAAQRRLAALRESDRARAETRELTTRFGSHELRTRLTIARSAVELIEATRSDEQERADAALAINELDKALATATNLLTLMRVDGPPRTMTIDVPTLIADIGRRWEIRADRAWSFTADPMTIEADPDRIEAALDCLIENAVKFTEEYDAISVQATAEGPDVVFAVRDSGAGIPEEELDRVVQPFETSSTAGARGGSGLGLAIVRAVAESRGGTVTTRSALGRGTEIHLRTPRVPRFVHQPAVARPGQWPLSPQARPATEDAG